MSFDDYKVVLYRNQPDGWVAEIPSIAECHALMPTAKEALAELAPIASRPAMNESNRLVTEKWSKALALLPVGDFNLAGPVVAHAA